MSTQQTPGTTSDHDEELTVIAKKDVFQQVIDQLDSIVDEAAFRLGKDGLDVEAMDPATVAMVSVSLSPDAFEHVGDGQYYFGINLERFDDYLGNANSGDLVEIAFDPETRRLHIQHTSVEADMAGIDPDAIRDTPDPTFDQGVEFAVEGSDLTNAVDNACLASNQVRFTSNPDDDAIHVLGEGDMDTVEVELTQDDELIDADIPEEVTSLFSESYLANSSGVLDPIPSGAEVDIALGDEKPIEVSYRFAGGHGSAELFVSPRLETR